LLNVPTFGSLSVVKGAADVQFIFDQSDVHRFVLVSVPTFGSLSVVKGAADVQFIFDQSDVHRFVLVSVPTFGSLSLVIHESSVSQVTVPLTFNDLILDPAAHVLAVLKFVAVVALPRKLGAVTDVVATIVPFAYIREYPPAVSQDPSHHAHIQFVAPIDQTTCNLFDGVVVQIQTFQLLFNIVIFVSLLVCNCKLFVLYAPIIQSPTCICLSK